MSNRGYAMVRHLLRRRPIMTPRRRECFALHLRGSTEGAKTRGADALGANLSHVPLHTQEHGYCHVWAQCFAKDRHPSWCKVRVAFISRSLSRPALRTQTFKPTRLLTPLPFAPDHSSRPSSTPLTAGRRATLCTSTPMRTSAPTCVLCPL